MRLATKSNVNMVVRRYSNMKRKLTVTKKQNFLRKRARSYLKVAKSIADVLVYVNFKPSPRYERTFSLLNSIESTMDKDMISIYMNPQKIGAISPQSGPYQYYPAFVEEGRFFGKQGDPRGFYNAWRTIFSDLFPRQYYEEVVAASLRR